MVLKECKLTPSSTSALFALPYFSSSRFEVPKPKYPSPDCITLFGHVAFIFPKYGLRIHAQMKLFLCFALKTAQRLVSIVGSILVQPWLSFGGHFHSSLTTLERDTYSTTPLEIEIRSHVGALKFFQMGGPKMKTIGLQWFTPQEIEQLT